MLRRRTLSLIVLSLPMMVWPACHTVLDILLRVFARVCVYMYVAVQACMLCMCDVCVVCVAPVAASVIVLFVLWLRVRVLRPLHFGVTLCCVSVCYVCDVRCVLCAFCLPCVCSPACCVYVVCCVRCLCCRVCIRVVCMCL